MYALLCDRFAFRTSRAARIERHARTRWKSSFEEWKRMRIRQSFKRQCRAVCSHTHTQTHSHTGSHTQGIHSKNILVCWKGSSSQHVHRPSTHSVQKPYACQLVCCSHPCDWRTTVIEEELITNAQKIACHRTHLNTNWATYALFECVYWGNGGAEGRRNYHLSDTPAQKSGNFLPMRAPRHNVRGKWINKYEPVQRRHTQTKQQKTREKLSSRW